MHVQKTRMICERGLLPLPSIESGYGGDTSQELLANMWAIFLLNLKGYGEEGDELEAKEIVLKKKLSMKA